MVPAMEEWMMGRNWRPKFKCICLKCGWIGTRAHTSRPCPRCNAYQVVKQYPNQTEYIDGNGCVKNDPR